MVRDLVELKSLDIFDCENIQEIFSKEGDQDKEKVVGGVITLLKLEKIQLQMLPRLVGIFCKSMDSVEVEGGGSTSSTTLSHKLFSSNTILWFPNLVELSVEYCELLEVVFDLEGLKVIEKRQPIIALSQLRHLKLENLSGIAYVWKNIPKGFQGFQNLVSIEINICDNLRGLIPPPVAKLLVQLQSIEIWECQLMENIIEREDEGGEEIRRADIIVFPQIRSFELNELANLVSFSSEAHSLEWPSIKQIKLVRCPKLKTFGSGVQSGRKLRKKDAELDARVPQKPSTGSSSASTRESSRLFNLCLELSCVPCCKNYNPDQENCNSSSEDNKHNFNKDQVTLTNQDESNVSETENQTKMCFLFPYYLIESLGNLEILIVSRCDSLEVIFELDDGLRDLEESNYIFNNLTRLALQALLLHIWKKGPQDIKGFNNLRLLDVWGCHSLKCLFTPSIAKLLVKLKEIRVRFCDEMEEIIAKESGDEEKIDNVIAFPRVKTLELKYLPKLECFCNEAISFEWPSLEKINIHKCEGLKMFVPTTSTKTPKLQGVYTGWPHQTFQPMIEVDLNTTIQHIIKGKVNLQEISESSRSP